MSYVVWKSEVAFPDLTGRSFVVLPATAVPLSVGLQDDVMVVWSLMDRNAAPEPGMAQAGPRRLIVANTGQHIPEFPETARFLGTVTTQNGIVWHVWDGDAETTA